MGLLSNRMKSPLQYILVDCEFCHGNGVVDRINPAWLIMKRKNAKRSLRSVADEIGVSAAYISDIEKGKRRGNHQIITFYENL